MEPTHTKWTQDELKAYLALYCFNFDFNKKNNTLDYAIFKIEKSKAEQLVSEFQKDNDYRSIQKISTYIANNQYSEGQLHELFHDLTSLIILSGRKCSDVIRSIILGLERTLSFTA